MKIAVVSDIHDNWANLDRFSRQLNELEEIEHIVVCGDIASPETLRKMGVEMPEKTIHAVCGNVDGDIGGHEEVAKDLVNIRFYGQRGSLELNKKKIGFTHRPSEAREIAKGGDFDIVFYGHTHQPWEERQGECILLNPGELTYFFYTPTYAIYDLIDMKAELVLLNKPN
jgi:putative phosphoesterase